MNIAKAKIVTYLLHVALCPQNSCKYKNKVMAHSMVQMSYA